MKTVTKGAGETLEVRRVSDEVANTMVKGGEWKYCPKQAWKKRHNPKPEAPKEQVKAAKAYKAVKEGMNKKEGKAGTDHSKGKRAYMETKAEKEAKVETVETVETVEKPVVPVKKSKMGQIRVKGRVVG